MFVSDLISPGGRELLERLAIPEPWWTTLHGARSPTLGPRQPLALRSFFMEM